MKKNMKAVTTDRHGHLITQGSAEGERETIEAAIRDLEFKQHTDEPRGGGRVREFPRQAGNRKMTKAA
jgi:hypothetical protein